jgi:hypothetical protein
MSQRKNEDRIGSPNLDSNVPVTPETMGMPQMPPHMATDPQAQANPLTFVAPTEFVELPSGGRFYETGHPLKGQQVIEVRHMTAKEEDILTSQSLLKKGVALDRFLQSLIVDKRIRTDDLLVGDKNAVLVNARVNGYGAEYTTNVTCPNCQANTRYQFDLNEHMVQSGEEYLNELENIQIHGDRGTVTITLPTTGWAFECRPMTGKDEKALTKAVEARRKRKLSEEMLSQQITMFTVSISGVTDRGQIGQAIQSLPARDSRHLRQTYQKLMPNLDLTQVFECGECGHVGEMEVPFTTDFFWPKQ